MQQRLYRYSPRRWWQNFGFGIESKTDYAFLHDVIRERLPYYAYGELERDFPCASRSSMRKAKLLFMLCNAAKGKRLTVIGSFSDVETAAILKADGQTIINEDPPKHFHDTDMLIINGINTVNSSTWHSVTSSRCITFDMVDIGIAIFDKNRYPEHYNILQP